MIRLFRRKNTRSEGLNIEDRLVPADDRVHRVSATERRIALEERRLALDERRLTLDEAIFNMQLKGPMTQSPPKVINNEDSGAFTATGTAEAVIAKGYAQVPIPSASQTERRTQKQKPYCWRNSVSAMLKEGNEAAARSAGIFDPRDVKPLIARNVNAEVWLDIDELQEGSELSESLSENLLKVGKELEQGAIENWKNGKIGFELGDTFYLDGRKETTVADARKRLISIVTEKLKPKLEAFKALETLKASESDTKQSRLILEILRDDTPESDKLIQSLVKTSDINGIDDNGDTPLMHAVRKCRLNVVEVLIEAKANVNATNNLGNTAMHVAVKNFDVITKMLIEAKPNVNVDNFLASTVRMKLLDNIDTVEDIIEFLIEAHANIEAQNSLSLTPLHIAINLGNLELVQVLVNHGASLDSAKVLRLAAAGPNSDILLFLLTHVGLGGLKTGDAEWNSLLMEAVAAGNASVVFILLRSGASSDGMNDGAPLVHAVSSNNVFMCKILVSAGAQTSLGSTPPVVSAAQMESLDALKFLVEIAKADINIRDSYGITALSYACVKGYEAICMYLLEKGALVEPYTDVELTDPSRPYLTEWIPFVCALRSNNVNLVKLLSSCVSEETLTRKMFLSWGSMTPFEYAVSHGHLETIKYLVQKANMEFDKTTIMFRIYSQPAAVSEFLIASGASITAERGQTNVVNHLAHYGQIEILRSLSEKGLIDLNASDSKGLTPLLTAVDAVKTGHGVVKFILSQSGVDINKKGLGGVSALHIAVNMALPDVVKLLLDHGANSNICDDLGRSPLDICATTHVWDEKSAKVYRKKISDLLTNAGGERILAISTADSVDSGDLLPSGAWGGFWVQNGKKGPMELNLQFHDRIIHGSGFDRFGPFSIEVASEMVQLGTYTPVLTDQMQKVKFSKQYSTYIILYDGLSKDRMIVGKYSFPSEEVPGGEFQLSYPATALDAEAYGSITNSSGDEQSTDEQNTTDSESGTDK
ncbi:hypothetical protein HK100_004045 [Physocladia obscura]|uniref:Uncharacterized protein n=1 Tax=Physocladia obscura TaxID=109957 RepID=A0AAD5XCV4_9FUNG|nr:hypothetical protein HK100_004045 [Physocladia obscura]